MSIELSVHPYCENCPHFDAVSDRTVFYSMTEKYNKTTVYCSHSAKCRAIAEYLKKEIEKEHDKT